MANLPVTAAAFKGLKAVANAAPENEWVEGWSSAYGRPFWSNAALGKSVWVKPLPEPESMREWR